MKVLLILVSLVLFISCSRKSTGSPNIQALTIKDTSVMTLKEEPQQKYNNPFTTVEQMPSFPGGETEMHRFLRDNLKYPVIPEEEGFIGRTAVRFVVTKTGAVKDVVPATDRYKRFAITDSLISVVKRMPRWIPGKQNGETVDVYFTLPLYISPARR